MKNFKKIAATIAALSLAACMAAPMATMNAFAYDVTITKSSADSSDATHKYKAYQVFTGKASVEDGKTILSNIDWGTGVNGSALLTALKDLEYAEKDIYPDDEGKNTSETKVKPFDKCTNAKDVADVLADFADDSVVAKDFAEKVGANLITTNTTGTYSATDGMKITGLTDGYYLIMDDGEPTTEGTAKPNSSAMTRFMLKVVGGNVEVTTKVAAPSVDKQVLDNDTDTATDETDKNVDDSTQKAVKATESGLTGYWGETADHAINETFQFKLTAQLPNNDEINEYKAYTLKFHDKWSDGVTPNDTLNIKLYLGSTDTTGTVIPAKSGDGSTQNIYYEIDTTGKTLDVVIKDVKQITGFSSITTGLKNLEVSVTYDAHLNENATVSSNADDKNWTDNENTVDLEYSNNPNATGEGNPGTDTGKTPKDSVWVFTYEVDNKKVKETAEGEALADAEFKLYLANTEGNAASNTEVKLAYNDTEKYYYPIEDQTSGTGIVMKSGTDGLFNIHGLDEGTYFLVETKAPDGYNTAAPTKVVIDTTHAEETNGTHANKVTFTGSTEGMNNTIIDNKGATLPSTGGIGTTIFYVVGGVLVVGAGVTLITKKRMTKD